MSKALGEKLREIRIARDYTQPEVSDRMRAAGCPINKSNISRWENGYNSPSVEQFLTLCSIYQVPDIVAVFLDGQPVENAHCLNRQGREKLEEYRQLLIASGMYRPAQNVVPLPVRRVPFYELPASAGYGTFLDSEDYEMVEIGEEVPDSATFGVTISGDSMEPAFHSGNVVWVAQQQTLENDDIGLVTHNGQAYVKQFACDENGIRLISLNPAYAPMEICEGDTFRIFGKVVATTPRP